MRSLVARETVQRLEIGCANRAEYRFGTGKFNGDHDVPVNKLYAEGTLYNNIKARVGKFGAFSSYGRVWDTEVTGGEIFFDNKTLPTKI